MAGCRRAFEECWRNKKAPPEPRQGVYRLLLMRNFRLTAGGFFGSGWEAFLIIGRRDRDNHRLEHGTAATVMH
jgi:hypothetical protein